MRQGRRRLADLLPWARAEAAKPGFEYQLGALGRAQAAHIIEDNFAALVVVQAPLGGWHADLMLKETPAGFPNALGSPVESPLASKREAEDFAKRLLCYAVAISAQAKTDPTPPVFLFYDWSIDLQAALMAKASKGWGGHLGAPYMQQRAIETLDSMVHEFFHGDVTDQRLRQLSDHQDRLLSLALHAAALNGIFAYPIRRDAPPPTHETHQTEQ